MNLKRNATAILLLAPFAAPAGTLDNAGSPASGSGMPTLTGIYTQLTTGAQATPSTSFQEPTAGPTNGTGYSLLDILGVLPVLDNTNGALAADVRSGKTYWGLTNGQWGLRTGAMPMGSNVTGANGVLSIGIPAGYHDGSKTATATDANLVSANIVGGKSIFGVVGSAQAATGTATAADVLSGKTFSNSGGTGISGTMANIGSPTIMPGTANQSLTAGYYSGGTVNGDANLVSGNIKSGATIFGISGSSTVVDTAGATATSTEICAGSSAYVNGVLVTGTATCCVNGLAGKNCDILPEPYAGGTFPTYSSNPWNCVFDTSTRLVWEVKLPGHQFRGNNEAFSWYDDNSATNGGNAGTPNAGVCVKTGDCDTQHYVADVNAAALCGFTDWRMPTESELNALYANYAANSNYFPNSSGYVYWSASTNATDPSKAWYVNFGNGYPSTLSKSQMLSVILVRGGQ